MSREIYTVCISIVANASFIRFGWIVVGLVKAVRNYGRASTTRAGWPELLTWPEMFILFGLTIFLFANRTTPDHVALGTLFPAVLGAILSVIAVVISFWAFFSLPTVSVGHYVLGSQSVVENGPYKWVRHPIYLGVFMIWIALAMAFQSALTFLIVLVYVIPSYVYYMRSEEQMMAGAYASYADYQRRVGMVFPRLHRVSAPLRA